MLPGHRGRWLLCPADAIIMPAHERWIRGDQPYVVGRGSPHRRYVDPDAHPDHGIPAITVPMQDVGCGDRPNVTARGAPDPGDRDLRPGLHVAPRTTVPVHRLATRADDPRIVGRERANVVEDAG